MKWRRDPEAPVPPTVIERIRPVEVPILTEVKRRLGRDDLTGAVLYAYPQVVRDLGSAYGVEIPPGYSHAEIVTKCVTEAMAPSIDFFERLYRLYAPVRYGNRAPPGSGDDLMELLQSLYGAEPMWRLYVAPAVAADRARTSAALAHLAAPTGPGEG